MTGNRPALAAFAALALLFGGPTASLGRQDDEKTTSFILAETKGGLTKRDREIVEAYLSAHKSDFHYAPGEVAFQVNELRQWTQACAPYAQGLPKQLLKQLSDPPEGTVRVIFDRAVLVISVRSGRVIERVDADE